MHKGQVNRRLAECLELDIACGLHDSSLGILDANLGRPNKCRIYGHT